MPEKEYSSYRDFLPTTPEAIVVTTGRQQVITDVNNRFFDDVLNYLGVTQNARRVFVEIRPFYMSKDSLGNTMLQEEAEFLVVKDCPVASVSYIRDDFNFVQGLFSLYLTPQWEERVRDRLIPPDGEIIYIR